MRSSTRTGVFVGFTTMAVTLAMASTAFACTLWAGKFTMTATAGPLAAVNSASGTTTVDGQNGTTVAKPDPHSHCGPDDPTVSGAATAHTANNGQNVFDFTVAPTTACNAGSGANQLPPGAYRLLLINKGWTKSGSTWGYIDCMDEVSYGSLYADDQANGSPNNLSPMIAIGAMVVNTGGNGSATAAMPPLTNNAANEAAGVCLAWDNSKNAVTHVSNSYNNEIYFLVKS